MDLRSGILTFNYQLMQDSTKNEESNGDLLEEYTHFFASAKDSVNVEKLLEDLSKKHISYHPSSPFKGVRAEPVSAERRGALVRFRVDIGGFTLMILVLNVAGRASKICKEILYENLRRSLVIQERVAVRSNSCVGKRINFTRTIKILTQEKDKMRWEVSGSPTEVKEMVMECAFAKLCAALGIGVPVGSPDHPFDLVCYEDCIEFFMEKCIPMKECLSINMLIIEERLKYCVQVMHTFHLIHKDIKLDNTLVTEDGRVVLADFDVSTHVEEQAGQASVTFREGTFSYMSSAMKNIPRYGVGKVDLYHNDMWAIKMLMAKLRDGNYNKPNVREQWDNVSSSDQAVYGLACAISRNYDGSHEKEMIAMGNMLFGSYFR